MFVWAIATARKLMSRPAFRTFGLPPCLHVPIASANLAALEQYVGRIAQRVVAGDGRVNAVLVIPHDYPVRKTPGVKLWQQPQAAAFEQRLHPARQVWVHVDFDGYRDAWRKLGLPDPGHCFLDHVQNREAIRLRGYSHPYVRLCPVSRRVNTSGGSDYGGEGMEKQFLRDLPRLDPARQAAAAAAMAPPIVYADPMDLTKMLDIPPGTQVLEGVNRTQQWFYP